MKTTKSVLFIFFLLESCIFGQSLSVGVSGGISIIQGPNYFTNNLGLYGIHKVNGTESSFAGLEFKNENSFVLKIDYGIKNNPIRLITQINYIPMRGNGSIKVYDQLSQWDIQEEVTTKLDIWSLCVGAKYKVNFRKISPYAQALFLVNYFGDTRLEFDYGTTELTRVDYKNGMRYGLNFGLGIVYNIRSDIDLDIGASYSLMNMWNSRKANPSDYPYESVESKMNTINLLIGVNYTIL